MLPSLYVIVSGTKSSKLNRPSHYVLLTKIIACDVERDVVHFQEILKREGAHPKHYHTLCTTAQGDKHIDWVLYLKSL